MGLSTLLFAFSLLALFSVSAQRACADPLFNQIRLVIVTGGDDLRGNSTADAQLVKPNGVVRQNST
jgi:hypothetical protein